jgi:hypothetical protein
LVYLAATPRGSGAGGTRIILYQSVVGGPYIFFCRGFSIGLVISSRLSPFSEFLPVCFPV